MYARLQSVQAVPSAVTPPEVRDRLVETIAGHPGFAGIYLLEQVDHGRGTMLTLWDTEEDARRASERTAAQLGPRPLELETDEVYEVTGDHVGLDDRPGAAATLWLDGPLSQARVDAARFAGRERIAPALAPLPGPVRALELWQAHTRSMVVVLLATSPDTLQEIHRTVMSTELLPGEDPALLTGHDRMEEHLVVSYAHAPEGAKS